MLKIHLLWPGKTKEKWLRDGINFYIKRIKNYYQVNQIETRAASGKIKNREQALDIEAKGLERAMLSLSSRLVVLDVEGKDISSEGLADFLKDLEYYGTGDVMFVIGGAYGLAKQIIDRADLRLSMSRMTFTHEMSRLILVEQIYRAATINAGSPYHH
jgi:23S rRNA (pseudouridine1915-N3)-methyltransferase